MLRRQDLCRANPPRDNQRRRGWPWRGRGRADSRSRGRPVCPRAPSAYMGEAGTIPFMGMLGEKFPDTQFVIAGVLGPHSNAHGPNEFLHIPTAARVTMAAARLIAAHHDRTDR